MINSTLAPQNFKSDWDAEVVYEKRGMVIANTFILSFALTKWYQLSPICAADGPPFLSRKELRMELCPLAGFRMPTCIRKNSAFPLQSRRLCTASSRRLAEQGQSLVLAGY